MKRNTKFETKDAQGMAVDGSEAEAPSAGPLADLAEPEPLATEIDGVHRRSELVERTRVVLG